MFGEYPIQKIISQLEADDLLPGILFRSARKQCDIDVQKLAESRGGNLPQDAQVKLRAAADNAMAKYHMDESIIHNHPQFTSMIRTGVGAHHAGQLLVWRLLLEELMSKGELRLLIATGTVAAGVDFPARSVVVTAHSRRGAEGFEVLRSSEFQQMSGRAGRRGKDAVGVCLVAPSQYSDARVLLEVAKKPPEPLTSSYFAAPSTVLNLLKYRNVDDLRFTVERSLAAFLDKKAADALRAAAQQEEDSTSKVDNLGPDAKKKREKRIRRHYREADEVQNRCMTELDASLVSLRKLGYMENSGLTEKGMWAAHLCTSLVLELGEAIDSHLLDDLSSDFLAGMVASISGDPHRVYWGLRANPIPKKYFEEMQEILTRVKQAYQSKSTSESKVLPDAALTVMMWMEARDWNEFSALLRLAGVAEGDVARLINQTADTLNQISRLEDTHPDLARVAVEARMKLLRPPLTEGLVG